MQAVPKQASTPEIKQFANCSPTSRTQLTTAITLLRMLNRHIQFYRSKIGLIYHYWHNYIFKDMFYSIDDINLKNIKINK